MVLLCAGCSYLLLELVGHGAARHCPTLIGRAGGMIATHTSHGPQVVNIPPATQTDDVVVLTSLGAPLPDGAGLGRGDHKVQQQPGLMHMPSHK